jgi:hypothetical protein
MMRLFGEAGKSIKRWKITGAIKMWPATEKEYDRLNGWRKGEVHSSAIKKYLSLQVKDHVRLGCVDKSHSLGIRKMPEGYALMLNADYSHYYWLRHDGGESVIHWNKWEVYRWAKYDCAKKNN